MAARVDPCVRAGRRNPIGPVRHAGLDPRHAGRSSVPSDSLSSMSALIMCALPQHAVAAINRRAALASTPRCDEVAMFARHDPKLGPQDIEQW